MEQKKIYLKKMQFILKASKPSCRSFVSNILLCLDKSCLKSLARICLKEHLNLGIP